MFLGGILATLEYVFALLDPYWEGIIAVALIVTLIFVIIYAHHTKRLAESTHAMVEVQQEELGLNKRPTVSIHCGDEFNFWFRTAIRNFGNVHAKLKVRVRVNINGKELDTPNDSLYSGKIIWQIQAGGVLASTLNGHISLKEMLLFNKLPTSGHEKNPATVSIESWAIRHLEDESLLGSEFSKNPVASWKWYAGTGPHGGQWVPDVSPL